MAGRLTVSPELEQLHLRIGKLTVLASGSFSAGTEAYPFAGPASIEVDSSLMQPCGSRFGGPAVEIYGSFEAVAAGETIDTAALEVDAAKDGKSLTFAEGSTPELAANATIGIASSAGYETATVAALDTSAAMLQHPFQLQHDANVTVSVLSRPMRIVHTGAAWPFRAAICVHNGGQPAGLPFTTAMQSGKSMGSVSCAGGACPEPAALSAARSDARPVLRLHGVELSGFGAPSDAAVSFVDPSCQQQWPQAARDVHVSGCSIHSAQGSGIALEGCLASMHVCPQHSCCSAALESAALAHASVSAHVAQSGMLLLHI